MSQDRAEIGRLQELLARIGAGLDDFLKFERPDGLSQRSHWQGALERPLPRQGVGIDEVSRELLEQVIPNGHAMVRPGFTGYIMTGATTASAIASTAATIASPQRYQLTPFNLIEEMSLEWLAEMFGLDGMKGVYSSGGSVANLVALGAARQSAFEKQGHDPARDGVDRRVSIYASSECHHTIQRSGGVLGIGRRSIRLIDCDDRLRMRPDLLRQAIEADIAEGILPMAIVAIAGTTNTGAIDPLQEIGEIAREFDIWYHVDGAYGLPGVLDERISDRYRGLDYADSVIVDPHKWLGAATGVGATFVRDRSLLERAFTQEPAAYLEGSLEVDSQEKSEPVHSLDEFGIPYFDYGVELSAPCRGIAVWALIREIGLDGMRDRIRRHNDMAKELAEISRRHEKLELLLEPSLSICCFRYRVPGVEDLDRLNRRLCRRLIRENEYMPSTTSIDGKLALRPCFVGARTDRSLLDGMIAAIVRIGDELVSESR